MPNLIPTPNNLQHYFVFSTVVEVLEVEGIVVVDATAFYISWVKDLELQDFVLDDTVVQALVFDVSPKESVSVIFLIF